MTYTHTEDLWRLGTSAPSSPFPSTRSPTCPHTTPHLTSPHLTSPAHTPHLTSPHLTTPHHTTPHHTTPHLLSSSLLCEDKAFDSRMNCRGAVKSKGTAEVVFSKIRNPDVFLTLIWELQKTRVTLHLVPSLLCVFLLAFPTALPLVFFFSTERLRRSDASRSAALPTICTHCQRLRTFVNDFLTSGVQFFRCYVRHNRNDLPCLELNGTHTQLVLVRARSTREGLAKKDLAVLVASPARPHVEAHEKLERQLRRTAFSRGGRGPFPRTHTLKIVGRCAGQSERAKDVRVSTSSAAV